VLKTLSTRSPCIPWLCRLAESGWRTLGRRLWFTESYIVLVVFFFIYWFIYWFILYFLLIYSYWFIYLFFLLFIYLRILFIDLFCLFIYLFIRSFILFYLLIYLFIHLFLIWNACCYPVKQLNHFPVKYHNHVICTSSLMLVSYLTALSLSLDCSCPLPAAKHFLI